MEAVFKIKENKKSVKVSVSQKKNYMKAKKELATKKQNECVIPEFSLDLNQNEQQVNFTFM